MSLAFGLIYSEGIGQLGIGHWWVGCKNLRGVLLLKNGRWELGNWQCHLLLDVICIDSLHNQGQTRPSLLKLPRPKPKAYFQ
jgi:hypothetical protein